VRVGREELVTGADIGRRLGISRERVRQLAKREDFPEPVGHLGTYVIWRWADVERWGKREGRLK
jgi:predicted DNA-binding transcriptional regulator AlpA